MKIKVRCDCGKTLVAASELAGKKTKCPACGAVLRLPLLDEVSEQPASFLVTETGLNLTDEPQEDCNVPAEEMPHPFNFSALEQAPASSPEGEPSHGVSDSSSTTSHRRGREFAATAMTFLAHEYGIPGWMLVSTVVYIVVAGLLLWRLSMGTQTLDDRSVVTHQSGSSQAMEGLRSPFKCTADGFEAAAIGWGMPFKPNRRSDAEAMCRVSKFAATARTIGRHMWLCRRNGEVRAVMLKWGRASRNSGSRDAEQEDVDSFRGIADQLFSEKSAAEVMRWFIVSGPLLDQFQVTTDLVADTHPTVPTDMMCQKDGVRIFYRRIVMNETLVVHVVNFEIGSQEPGVAD